MATKRKLACGDDRNEVGGYAVKRHKQSKILANIQLIETMAWKNRNSMELKANELMETEELKWNVCNNVIDFLCIDEMIRLSAKFTVADGCKVLRFLPHDDNIVAEFSYSMPHATVNNVPTLELVPCETLLRDISTKFAHSSINVNNTEHEGTTLLHEFMRKQVQPMQIMLKCKLELFNKVQSVYDIFDNCEITKSRLKTFRRTQYNALHKNIMNKYDFYQLLRTCYLYHLQIQLDRPDRQNAYINTTYGIITGFNKLKKQKHAVMVIIRVYGEKNDDINWLDYSRELGCGNTSWVIKESKLRKSEKDRNNYETHISLVHKTNLHRHVITYRKLHLVSGYCQELEKFFTSNEIKYGSLNLWRPIIEKINSMCTNNF